MSIFGKKSISARDTADLFINETSVFASDTYGEFHKIVISALRSADDDSAEFDLNENQMKMLYFLMITALCAHAVNNLFGEKEKRSLIVAIGDSLSDAVTVEGDNSVIPNIYNRYVSAIQDGIKGIETGNPLLPHDAVAGLFIEDMELHKYEGVLVDMGDNHIVSPLFLMSISSPLLVMSGWWKRLSKKYKIK